MEAFLMDFDEFKVQLQAIYNHFQAKPFEKYMPAVWFEHVKHIPAGEPLKFIVEQILNLDGMPRNITKAFKSGWQAWMNTNQDRITRQQQNAKTKCDFCSGSGLIHFIGNDHGIKYQYASRCPRCRNWVDQVSAELPEYTKEFLQQRGYQVIEMPTLRMPAKKRDFKVLAVGIG
jgi:hypothetical protein